MLTIHAELVAHHSKPLSKLVNGQMIEAKEGCACLEDVDEDTFTRFGQYAYTLDYPVPDPDILLDHSTIAADGSKTNNAPLNDSYHRDNVEFPTDKLKDQLIETIANSP